jgi:hypothetical protein
MLRVGVAMRRDDVAKRNTTPITVRVRPSMTISRCAWSRRPPRRISVNTSSGGALQFANFAHVDAAAGIRAARNGTRLPEPDDRERRNEPLDGDCRGH